MMASRQRQAVGCLDGPGLYHQETLSIKGDECLAVRRPARPVLMTLVPSGQRTTLVNKVQFRVGWMLTTA